MAEDIIKDKQTEWLQKAVVYQIFPLTFNYAERGNAPSANEYGGQYGNIKGITERLDHVAELGADTIWLSPIFMSGLKHGFGYNPTDHNEMNPVFGDWADLKELIGKAHERGIRVITDQVYNHTSTEHEWFEKSRKSKGKYKDYYVWAAPIVGGVNDKKDPYKITVEGRHIRLYPLVDWKRRAATVDRLIKEEVMKKESDPIPEDYREEIWLRNSKGEILYPPNNWLQVDLEHPQPAWEYDEQRGECYLHSFHHSMPDLNINNEAVRDEILATSKRWLHFPKIENDPFPDVKGVDGFRLDAVPVYGADENMTKPLEGFHTDGNLKVLRAQTTSDPVYEGREDDYDRGGLILSRSIGQHQGQYGNVSAHELLNGIMKLVKEADTRTLGDDDISYRPAVLGEILCPGDCADIVKNLVERGCIHVGYTPVLGGTHDGGLDLKAIRDAVNHGVWNSIDGSGRGVQWTLEGHDLPGISDRWKLGHMNRHDGQIHDDRKEVPNVVYERTKLLNRMLTCFPGSISIFQGQELGVKQPESFDEIRGDQDSLGLLEDAGTGMDMRRMAIAWGDERDNSPRRFMKPTKTHNQYSAARQKNDPDSVLENLKSDIKTRRKNKVLNDFGHMEFIDGNDNEVMMFMRSDMAGSNHILCAFNFSTHEKTMDLDAGQLKKLGVDVTNPEDKDRQALKDQGIMFEGDNAKLHLPALSSRLINSPALQRAEEPEPLVSGVEGQQPIAAVERQAALT